MKFKMVTGCLMAAGLCAFMIQPLAADEGDGGAAGGIGPDVAVCQMINTQSFGRVGDIHAFSIETHSFNTGDEILLWQQNTNMHPVIAQNMYRYFDGRLEMIGMSWLKHGFCALQLSGCGSCPGGGGCPQWLQPGCRDPYSTSLNGQQSNLGPRSEVHASTGVFPYPYQLAWGQTGNAIYKRMQVHDDFLNPDLNPGARYFIEGQYVHQQEGTDDRRHNNATYERVIPSPVGTTYSLGTGFGTNQFSPAIFAWQAINGDVVIETVDVSGTPTDGRLHVAYRVRDLGDGTWRYDYAVHNLNSHRSVQAMTIHMGENVNITEPHFHFPPYHSGEPYSNLPWDMTVGPDSVSWATETYDENVNANAIRWSTMYNFGFVADSPPTMGEATLAIFRPGTVPSESVPVLVPEGSQGKDPGCPGDLNDDGVVNVSDLLDMLGVFGDCPGCDADLNDDGVVNVSDLLALLGVFGPCPE